MKVEQFKHANQFHIYGRDDTDTKIDILQSYNSEVVKIEQKRGCEPVITLGFDWDYSLTTARHVYDFLEEYGNISFDGITNKKQYINELIQNKKYQKGIVNITILYDWSMK